MMGIIYLGHVNWDTPFAFAVAWFSQDISTIEVGLYWIGGGGMKDYAAYIHIDYPKERIPEFVWIIHTSAKFSFQNFIFFLLLPRDYCLHKSWQTTLG